MFCAGPSIIRMPTLCSIERKSARQPLDVRVRVQRGDGTAREGRCVDASSEGFGITLDVQLEIGEILRLTIGRSENAPTFSARVVWQQDARVGLFCIGPID
jgi:hypothetical protein